MITILSAFVSPPSFRVRSRASLELKQLVALQHEVIVLRRQRPGQLRLFPTDRLLWEWLIGRRRPTTFRAANVRQNFRDAPRVSVQH